MKFLRRLLDDYLFLMGFLSRLPIPARLWPKRKIDPALALATGPFVGATLGLLAGLFALSLSPFLAPAPLSWATAVCSFLLGWGLHLDGLADLADGWGSGKTGEDMRRIMKDSAIGGYGAAALLFTLGLWTSLLAQSSPALWWRHLALAGACGRFTLCVTAWQGSYPWESGLGKNFVAGFHRPHLQRALLFLTLLLLPTGSRCWLPIPVAFLVGLSFERFARKRLGGVNGDVLGASAVAGEVVSLAILTATGG